MTVGLSKYIHDLMGWKWKCSKCYWIKSRQNLFAFTPKTKLKYQKLLGYLLKIFTLNFWKGLN